MFSMKMNLEGKSIDRDVNIRLQRESDEYQKQRKLCNESNTVARTTSIGVFYVGAGDGGNNGVECVARGVGLLPEEPNLFLSPFA